MSVNLALAIAAREPDQVALVDLTDGRSASRRISISTPRTTLADLVAGPSMPSTSHGLAGYLRGT